MICAYHIQYYIAIYDLCYEDYPNFSCFISNLPEFITYIIYNNEKLIQLKKKICYISNSCNYIKQIKGTYPLPIGNRKKNLMKIRLIIDNKNNSSEPVNVIIGNGILYKNAISKISETWISTDQDVLDITNRHDITQYLNPNTVDNMVAMHVFEHIFYNNIFNSLLNLKYLLKKKGKIYLCVPDLNSRLSPYWKNYTDAVNRQPLYGHRVIYSYESMKYIGEKCEFVVYPLSYHLNDGKRIVNKTNFILFKNLDIHSYIQYKINFDMGYSLCVVLEKK